MDNEIVLDFCFFLKLIDIYITFCFKLLSSNEKSNMIIIYMIGPLHSLYVLLTKELILSMVTEMFILLLGGGY